MVKITKGGPLDTKNNMSLQSGRRSRRVIKKKDSLLPKAEAGKRFRKCGKSGCPADRPECFSNAIERLMVYIIIVIFILSKSRLQCQGK